MNMVAAQTVHACTCYHLHKACHNLIQRANMGKHSHTHMSCCNKYSVERDDPSKPWRHLKNHEEKSFLHSYSNISNAVQCFCSILVFLLYPVSISRRRSIRSFLLSPYPPDLCRKDLPAFIFLESPMARWLFQEGVTGNSTMRLTPETTKTKHKQHQATTTLQASPGILGRDVIGAVDHDTWQCSNFQVGSGANALSRAQSSPSA